MTGNVSTWVMWSILAPVAGREAGQPLREVERHRAAVGQAAGGAVHF